MEKKIVFQGGRNSGRNYARKRELLKREIDDILAQIGEIRLFRECTGISNHQDIKLRNLEEKLSSKWSELKD